MNGSTNEKVVLCSLGKYLGKAEEEELSMSKVESW